MSEGNGFAKLEQFTSKAPRRYKDIEPPDNFGKVRIQSLSEGEKSRYETGVLTSKGGVNRGKLEQARRELMALCIVNPQNNERMISDPNKLQHMDGAVASFIYDECREHCGFDKEDIEQLVNFSESIPVSDSPTS